MRTVEQIKRELDAAREEEKKCSKKVASLEQEMKEIYLAAKNALGIEDKPQQLWRNDGRSGSIPVD